MCTVSYIPNKNNGGFVLTSNRDEVSFRPTISPQIYKLGDTKVCFPKDEKAGGSWIAFNDSGRVCCLLNGAFEVHRQKAFYAQSRGKVLTDMVSSELKPVDFFKHKNLEEIEPFTIITIEVRNQEIGHFSEFIWDSEISHLRELNPEKPHIWSSVTLYSTTHREMRKEWFRSFLKTINGNLSPENILDFHSGTHTKDNSINVVMEREGGLKTVSITQVFPENGKLRMNYFDLHNKNTTRVEL